MRHFFNIVADGLGSTDEQGAEFPDLDGARDEAVRTARELMADAIRMGKNIPSDAFIEILNEQRQILDVIPLETIAFQDTPRLRHSQLYNTVDQNYLLLSREFDILEANRAYLNATMTDLASISRQPMFEMFPDNPGDPAADGVRNLRVSLERVLSSKLAHDMPRQRYDLRRRDGSWEERHWKLRNYPVLDVNGEVEFIIHHVEDVTVQSRT
jgi:PAS domain-containing protein